MWLGHVTIYSTIAPVFGVSIVHQQTTVKVPRTHAETETKDERKCSNERPPACRFKKKTYFRIAYSPRVEQTSPFGLYSDLRQCYFQLSPGGGFPPESQIPPRKTPKIQKKTLKNLSPPPPRYVFSPPRTWSLELTLDLRTMPAAKNGPRHRKSIDGWHRELQYMNTDQHKFQFSLSFAYIGIERLFFFTRIHHSKIFWWMFCVGKLSIHYITADDLLISGRNRGSMSATLDIIIRRTNLASWLHHAARPRLV